MELSYYKHIEEADEYLTWKFNPEQTDMDFGWNKEPYPSYLDTSPTAIHWYKMSNIEDTHFIEMELEYCKKWYESIFNEIEQAKEYNLKLGY